MGTAWKVNMSPVDIAPRSLHTDRLVLRPTCSSDAGRAFDIQSDWEVARMLRTMSFPPSRDEVGRWFADHVHHWEAGEAYRFAVELEGQMIGMAYLDAIADGEANLGYWLDRAHWGQGYAFEAAQALILFGFNDVRLLKLRAGHAYDNPASGRVLAKLGFKPLDIVQRDSLSRGETIMQHRYVLEANIELR
ncbi:MULTISPECIES: GNAT family N-acetyltransferase [unclassified Bradyrhizobium]|uniref:GNAT family N-acetyltransferase n=2 Tax=unclassified Bradyrhizobium TaxID=2631580 RepID=UPI0028F09993|nr:MULTISPECIES: GNAT family N-acetyltransferase [unclassified Bradyrhizobium]